MGCMINQAEIEKWLDENTFECPLGRVSLWQCEQLRRRPKYDSKREVRLWLAGKISLLKPPECEGCKIWKKYAKRRKKR